MRKTIFGFIALFLVLAFGFAIAGSGREATLLPPQEVELKYSTETYMYQGKDTSSTVRFKILPNGGIATFNSSGTTKWLLDNDGNLVSGSSSWYIDSSGNLYVVGMKQDATVIGVSTQLSTWTGIGTAGQSYYQCEAGKRYIVDPYAIEQSFTRGTQGTFSGVTLVLPSAASYPEQTVKIELAVSGATGWNALNGSATGTTIVYVYPYPGTGTTRYGVGLSVPQTLLAPVQLLSGTTLYNGDRVMSSGASMWMLDKPGESVTYGLYNSQVSAYPVQWNFLN